MPEFKASSQLVQVRWATQITDKKNKPGFLPYDVFAAHFEAAGFSSRIWMFRYQASAGGPL